MLYRFFAAILASACLVSVGCTPTQDTQLIRLQPPQEFPRNGLLSSVVPYSEPTGILTLPQAISQVFQWNPELRSHAWEVYALEGRIVQAGLIPNPGIALELEDFGGTDYFSGITQLQTTLRLSQSIDIGGKRNAAVTAASLSHELALWDYDVNRIAIVMEISRKFIAVLIAQRRQDYIHESVRLAEQVMQVVKERVISGKVSPTEATKAQIALSSTQIELQEARTELELARQQLGSMWGTLTPTFQAVAGNIDTIPPLPALSDLSAPLERHPILARRATELAQRRAAVALEQANGVPDISLSVGLRQYRATQDFGLVAGVSSELPFFNRNQGNVQEAEARLRQAELLSRADSLRLVRIVADAYIRLAGLHANVTNIRDEILPNAQSAFEAVREGYALGRFALLDVLDAQRTLLRTRSEYLSTLGEYYTVRTELESLVGGILKDYINTIENNK